MGGTYYKPGDWIDSRVFIRISGSIFLESELDSSWLRQSESFRASVTHWNAVNATSDHRTRIDQDIQFSRDEQYDAYQKICMEMKYKWVL